MFIRQCSAQVVLPSPKRPRFLKLPKNDPVQTDNFSTRVGCGLGPRRPAREGVCGTLARFNSGSFRTPTGGPGTGRPQDARPAFAARALCPVQIPQPRPQDGPTRILLTCPPSAALRLPPSRRESPPSSPLVSGAPRSVT